MNPILSRLGFGSWQLGSITQSQEAYSLLKQAYMGGITVFDTAPNYGLGQSEKYLGERFASVRDRLFYLSKFGHHVDDRIDFNPLLMRSSVEGSLARLKTTYLDVLLLHNPNKTILLNREGHYEQAMTLKQLGLIRSFGVSVDTLEEMEIALRFPQIEVIEVLFNIFFQEPRKAFDQALRQKVKIIVKVPLDSGWLTGRYDEQSVFEDIRRRWSSEDKHRRVQAVRYVQNLVHDDALTKYAMGFIRHYDAVTSIIPGMHRESQLQEHLKDQQYVMPKPFVKMLEQWYDQTLAHQPFSW